MTKIVLVGFAAILTIITGCINLSTRDLSNEMVKTAPKKLPAVGKNVQVFLTYSIDNDGNLDKNKSNVQNATLELNIAAFLDVNFGFKSAHMKPTLYQKHAFPEKYKDDYLVKVTVFEGTTDEENFLQMLFRGLSFGFYPQKLKKQITYNVHVTEVQTNKVLQVESKVVSEWKYQAPMLVIPINLDSHPFTAFSQKDIHMEKLGKLLRKVFE